MRHVVIGLLLAGSGCFDTSAPPSAPGPEPIPPGPESEILRRVKAKDLTPSVDGASVTCDGDRWVVSAEVIGSVSAVRAVVVQTDGPRVALDLALEAGPERTGPWRRFETIIDDDATPCVRRGVATVLEVTNADGRTAACLAFGHDARALLDGAHDDRLGRIPRGAWDACRVR